MKLICDRDQLLASFQTAAAVAPARSPKPVLQNVKIEAGKEATVLLATDLEVGIRIQVQGIEVEKTGSALLPIGRVGAILRESPSDAKLFVETDKQGTVIKGERSEFRLPAENPDEFPAVATFTEGKYHEVPGRLFRELVRRTLFATDNESSRYALGGVLVEMAEKKITAVGTDGRRLAKMEGPAQSVGGHSNADMMTIIPARAMQLMDRAFTDSDEQVQIAARPNDVLVRSPRVTIYSRLVEGRFPKWRDVFPHRQDVQKIELPVGPFYSAVRQAADCHQRGKPRCRFHVRRGTMRAGGPSGGRRAVACRIAGQLQRPKHVDHARSAVYERFPESARSREDIHIGIERRHQRRRLPHGRRLRLCDHAAGARSMSGDVPLLERRLQRRFQAKNLQGVF